MQRSINGISIGNINGDAALVLDKDLKCCLVQMGIKWDEKTCYVTERNDRIEIANTGGGGGDQVSDASVVGQVRPGSAC